MPRSHLWLFVAFALILAACRGANADDHPTTTTAGPTTTTAVTTTTTPTTTTTKPPGPVSPLNGLPAEDPALLERSVLAVKIDNHWDARPQSGIQEADAVYELVVEAGLTRFIALFHDNDSDYLGPMRSGRPTDPTLLAPLGATFAISGAQDWVTARIVDAGIPLIGEVRPGTFRISSRSAPHNLYVDTALLREYAESRGYSSEPPPDLLAWGEAPPAEPGAESITIRFSSESTALWEWDGVRYLRSTNGEEHQYLPKEGEAGRVAADTLVVLFVEKYTASPPSGSGGSSVPAMETVGGGRALVFFGGNVTEGSWSRDAIDSMISLSDPDGNVLTVPPGVPWISLVPDTGIVSW
ncbi:MAG: DUF3048 domain-containing protein [Acidimicrobiia bacterium]|nr:DUF3048 domain-containing protein [Acidimicrobiia bacterium]